MFQNEHLTRQSDIIPHSVLREPITIIGAGAIGSWTTLALAKMGFTDLTVWDHDRVDKVNLNSQFYPWADAVEQKYKVKALHDLVLTFTPTKIKTHGIPWRSQDQLTRDNVRGIWISAVDSMAVRRDIWEYHKDKSIGMRAIIDPRMGAEEALLYVVNPMSGEDQGMYEKTLYIDAQAVQEACTAKATIYTANMLSGLVCKAVKDLLTTPNYLRTAAWNIKGNEFLAGTKKVL